MLSDWSTAVDRSQLLSTRDYGSSGFSVEAEVFVGHMAVALGAKVRAPRSSLGLFVAAAFALDLLWPVFLLLGIERVRIDPGSTKFTPLAFDSYPWSHSLVMVAVWGVVGSLLVRLWRGNRETQVLVLLLVISHWVLDFVSHRADMPLWPGNSPLLGLGLWKSVAATLIVEGAMFAAALMVYLRSTTAADRIGSVGFWLLIVSSTLLWASQPWSSPPPSPELLAWFGLGTWLFPLWAGWADGHRAARAG